jgi:hypothetical protein
LPAATPEASQDVNSLSELLLNTQQRSLLRSTRSPDEGGGEGPAAELKPLGAVPGIRKLEGSYLTLYTDLPPSVETNEIPAVFDRAVPQWAKYFQVPAEQLRGWRLTGCLMEQPQRFRTAGIFPADLPEFLHGYHRGRQLWVYDQPSAYYRRHLVLHEGVHAFMLAMLGGTGPPWYREGMAELLATHRWQGGSLQVRFFPQDRNDVPYWGRIKVIQDEFAAERGLMLREVLQLDESSFLQLPAYAWSWAAAAFLDGMPSFRQRFRDLSQHVAEPHFRFQGQFQREFIGELRELDEQWQLFVVELDYGYDLARMEIKYEAGRAIPAGGATTTIAADHGWQSTGWRLQAGRQYRVTAEGRYRMRGGEAPLWSEADGITLQYVRGRPLGMLLGNVRLAEPKPPHANLIHPIPLGRTRVLNAVGTGTLYLRTNDAPGGMADNAGEVTVTIVPLPVPENRD